MTGLQRLCLILATLWLTAPHAGTVQPCREPSCRIDYDLGVSLTAPASISQISRGSGSS
jgi:hypothetical protein